MLLKFWGIIDYVGRQEGKKKRGDNKEKLIMVS